MNNNLPELGRDPLSEDAFLPLRFLCKPKQPPILLEQALDSWQPYIYIDLVGVLKDKILISNNTICVECLMFEKIRNININQT